MLKRTVLILTMLVLASTAKADISFNGGGGGGGSNNGPVIGFLFDTTPGAGKTYTPPGGTVRVHACVVGGGGGGGGATTGGTAAVCGGTGASASGYCVWISGSALSAGITYTVAAGGSLGNCAVSATAGGNVVNSSILIGGSNIANSGTNANSGGAAATVTTSGAGGAVPALPTSKTSIFTPTIAAGINFDQSLVGIVGATGGADAAVAAPLQASAGGQGACVTSGGVCDASNPGSAGANGYASFTAYNQ